MRRMRATGGLGLAAISYVAVDYLCHFSSTWYDQLQLALWFVLALIAISRIPFYEHWSAELDAFFPFRASLVFMLSCLLFEALCVRSATAVLGLDWNRDTRPLPDTGQWLLLSLNEKLPALLVAILRAPIVGLYHYLMLFIILAFSVLFDTVEAPGLRLGAGYILTMGIGRLLRAITFISTIPPSPRPWCTENRFSVPSYPHPWAQKYYVPYASDGNAIHRIIRHDIAYANSGEYMVDYRPDWGWMSFLIDFLRPTSEESWRGLLQGAGGGCNDLLYSGHMLVSLLTAMAWTEAYGGFNSALIWMMVIHSAQRQIRERQHYSVDCVVAIYVGIFLWKMMGFIWPMNNALRRRKLLKLEKIQNRLIKAAKDSDMEGVRKLLKEVQLKKRPMKGGRWCLLPFGYAIVISVVAISFLLFKFIRNG